MTFFHKNLVPQNPITFSTIDNSSLEICFWVSYRCTKSIGRCTKSIGNNFDLKVIKWVKNDFFFTCISKSMVSKPSRFLQQPNDLPEYDLGCHFDVCSGFRIYYHQGRWATKYDVFFVVFFSKKSMVPELILQPKQQLYVISWVNI